MTQTGLLGGTGSGASATINGIYRYTLHRRWHETAPPVLFVMLNPSTADESVDDPTVRKCVGFARGSGYGGIVVVNLFARRSRDPLGVFAGGFDPVGPFNDHHIRMEAECLPLNARVCVAWGANIERPAFRVWAWRCATAVKIVRAAWHGHIHCLGTTKAGNPKHPLMIPYKQDWQAYQ